MKDLYYYIYNFKSRIYALISLCVVACNAMRDIQEIPSQTRPKSHQKVLQSLMEASMPI
jgi:hypothetical protein